MSYLPFIILAAGGLILTLGDVLMKKWVVSSNNWVYLGGLSIWIIGLNFLAMSFKYKNIAVASTILVLINVIALAIVSWLVFEEKLTLHEMVGIVVGLIAIIILELK